MARKRIDDAFGGHFAWFCKCRERHAVEWVLPTLVVFGLLQVGGPIGTRYREAAHLQDT